MRSWRKTGRKGLEAEEDGHASSHGGLPVAEFEELALPLFDSLYNFARWMARDVFEAEDLVQETYLKALRSLASFQPGTNLRAWMFRILKNTFLSSRSRLERRMTVSIDFDDGPELIEQETPDAILELRSDLESVRQAVSNLPANSREVLLLCDVEGMSYKEIAEILAVPLGTVMSRLHRARSATRASLRCSYKSPAVPVASSI